MSKSVAEKKETNVVAFDASVFEEDAGVGLGQLGQEDVALPFLKVLSRQDPILDDLDDAKAGDIYNTVTGQVWKGKEGINVVPCVYQRRYIEWAPRGTGTGAPINIFTPDDQRPKTERSSEDNREYVVDGQGSYLEETHQHLVVIVSDDGSMETALIAMKSTQLKKSRKWNSMMMSVKMKGANGLFTPPMYSQVYRLTVVSQENAKGKWHGWEIERVGQVEDAGVSEMAKQCANSISAGDVKVKHQDESSDKSGGVSHNIF